MSPHTLTRPQNPSPQATSDVLAPGHLGDLTRILPPDMVDAALDETRTREKRRRDLPSRVIVYLIIAACLFPTIGYTRIWAKLTAGRVSSHGAHPSASGLSQARRRVGPAPLRWLFNLIKGPEGAHPHRAGVWWNGLLLTAIDGTILTVADQPGTLQAYTKQAGNHGGTGYPQARLLALVTCGTRTLIDAVFTHTRIGETTLVPALLASMSPGMLVLADRNFDAATTLQSVAGTGADFLIRSRAHRKQPACARFSDGSFASLIGDTPVRVIDARIRITTSLSREDHDYRLITTLMDIDAYPADQLLKLYHERWEVETVFYELKSTILHGRVLRARTAAGVDQEIYALLIAYQLIRTAISDATGVAGTDPDRGSFTVALEAAKDQMVLAQQAVEDSGVDLIGTIGAHVLAAVLPARRLRVCPRIVKRAISKYQARGGVDRTNRTASLEISILPGAPP